MLCFFKICCVFLYVRSARTVAVRHAARARAVYARARRVRTCDARARENRTRAHRARALYVPYARTVPRTVREKCVPNFAVLFSKSDVFFFNICCVFFKSAVFFSHVRSAHTVVVSYGTHAHGAHVRAARTCARVRCTAHARGVRVRSAQCACMACVRLMSVAQPARSAADAFEPSFRSLGLLCFLSNKKHPHSLTPV